MKTDEKSSMQAQGQGAERPDMERIDGWKTAGPKSKKGAPQARQGGAQGQQGPSGGKAATHRNSKLSPTRLKNGNQQRDDNNKAAGKQLSGADPGDGSVVFGQLCQYLNTRASQAYVAHTAMRLSDLAKERRYRAFEKALSESERNGKTTQELRESWSDTAPEYRQDKYGGLTSVWRLHTHEHQGRLYQLLIKWVVNERVKQRELEDRLQFFTFEAAPQHIQLTVDEPTPLRGSYREAVGPAERTRATPRTTTEQERLTALCLEPAELLTQLRERTEDEVKAIVMILNHEIEVPNVPPFLVQSMDPSELACFEDIFMALEYPLYAHLAPGQRFFDNMTKGAVLAQIYAGVEAAPAQKCDIENFKKTLSRITLDMDTRVVKITFKGKQSAARWTGWQMPLAGKPLPLIDYESIRERAKVTKELVLLDSYQFEVEVRKGEMTSTDMHWVLTQKLGLKVQSMMHPVTELTGIKAQQWQVRIKANSCPDEIRHNSLVVVDSAEIVVHHLNTNVNWPCRRCQSPEHPTKYCRVSEAELETEAAKYKIQRNGKLPSTLGQSSRVYAAGNHPKTMADLEALLRKEGDNQRTKAPSKRMTVGSLSKRENATKSNSTADMIGKLSLPPEWGQSVNSASGAPKEDSKASHDASVTSMGNDMASTEETEQNILEQHAKVTTGVTPTQCVDAKTAETAEEKETTRAKQVQPDTTNESNNTNFVEEEQPDVNQPEDSPGWGLHELYEEHKTESDSPSEWIADVEMEAAGCEGQRNSEYAEAVSAAKKNQTQQRAGRKEGGRGRSPTVRSRRMDKTKKDLQADFKQSSQDTAQRMSTRGRKGSLSPKRKAAAHWSADRNHDMLEELIGTDQIPRQQRTARSLSPKRRTTEATRRGEKMTMQKFIYQYMTDITGTDETKQADCNAKEQEERPTLPKRQEQQVWGSEERTDREANEERSNSDQEDQDCRVTHVLPPTDRGAPLDDWLGILGGKVVDVAANGQCGWIAFYAALYNIDEGLVEVTKAVADSANLLKKRVINSMSANIVDEIKSHPHELQSELRASGCHAEVNGGFDEQMCALVNHLVAQRDKPVKAKVPLHFWVRPAHIKAMAQFARETLYVLDVQEDDQARVQAYAYHDIRDAQDKDIEVGTVCPVPTEQAMALLRDLTAAGITPPVMVLRWRGGGNHFQAVHYPPASHDHYAENIAKLAEARNEILMEHGWKKLDPIEYDEEKTAKEATQVLKAVRKAAKSATQTAEIAQGEYRHEFERGTGNRKSIGTEVREFLATCDEPPQQAEIRSLQVLPRQQIVKESTSSSRKVASTAIEVRNSESTTGDHDDETGGNSKALPEISTKINEKVPVGMKQGVAEAPSQSAQAQGRVDSQ